jgi:hypothetical protein
MKVISTNNCMFCCPSERKCLYLFVLFFVVSVFLLRTEIDLPISLHMFGDDN